MIEADLGSKPVVHAYRNNFRRGLFEALSQYNVVQMFTGTWSPQIMDHEPSPVFLNKRISQMANKCSVNGVFVVETSHMGRQHIHGFVASNVARDTRHITFKQVVDVQIGKCQYDPVTDLIGAIAYVTKAFGPSTEYTWRLFNGSARRSQKYEPEDLSARYAEIDASFQRRGYEASSSSDKASNHAAHKPDLLISGNTGVKTLEEQFSG